MSFNIAKIIRAVIKWVADLFTSIEGKAKEWLPVVTDIVNNLKLVNNSTPAADIYTLIFGDKGDDIQDKVQRYLDSIAAEGNGIESCMNLTDPKERLKYYLTAINNAGPKEKQRQYSGIAGQLYEALTDVPFQHAQSITNLNYTGELEHKDPEITGKQPE